MIDVIIWGTPHLSPLCLDPAIYPIRRAIAATLYLIDHGKEASEEDLDVAMQEVIIAVPMMANSMTNLVVKIIGIADTAPVTLNKLWNKIIDILANYNQRKTWSKITVEAISRNHREIVSRTFGG